MKKIIPKFNDLIKTMAIFDHIPVGEIKVTMSNLDDIFMVLKEKGVDKLIVDWHIMLMVSQLIVYGLKYAEDSEKNKWDALKLMREGRVDKYLGIKLYLDDTK